MLVLKRRQEESIVIGGNITVKVLGVGPDGVKLGITAPAEVTVHRAEVQERITRSAAPVEVDGNTWAPRRD